MLPVPPSTTITTSWKASRKVKECGLIRVTRCTHSPPAIPAKKAPSAKASTRGPRHPDAEAGGRQFVLADRQHDRPSDECLSCQQT